MKTLLIAVLLASSTAFAGHHFHHHHSSGSSNSSPSPEPECLRWSDDAADAGTDAGTDAGVAQSEPVDGGLAGHVCLERAPAFGCSSVPGSAWVAFLAMAAFVHMSRRRTAQPVQ